MYKQNKNGKCLKYKLFLLCLKLHYSYLKSFRNGVKDTCQQGLNEEPKKS